jgi:hypothetical protein
MAEGYERLRKSADPLGMDAFTIHPRRHLNDRVLGQAGDIGSPIGDVH